MALLPVGDTGMKAVPAHDFHLCVITRALLWLTLISYPFQSIARHFGEITLMLMSDNLRVNLTANRALAFHVTSCHTVWWPEQGGWSPSSGPLTPTQSPLPSALLSTQPGGARADPPVLLLPSVPPVREQGVVVRSSKVLSLLLQATFEQSPLSQHLSGQPSSSRYGCGRKAAASPVELWHPPERTGDRRGDKSGSVAFLEACHPLHRAVTSSWVPESVCEAGEGATHPGTVWDVRLAELVLRTVSSVMRTAGG